MKTRAVNLAKPKMVGILSLELRETDEVVEIILQMHESEVLGQTMGKHVNVGVKDLNKDI